MRLWYFIKIDVSIAWSPDPLICGACWLATPSLLFVLVLCLLCESSLHSLDSHLLSTLMVPEAGDSWEEWNPAPPSRISIRWTGKERSPPSLTLLFPQCWGSPTAEQRILPGCTWLIIWHPSKWYSSNIFPKLLRGAAKYKRKEDKEDWHPCSVLHLGLQECQARLLHGGQSRMGVEPPLTSIFCQAFNLRNIFSLRVCHIWFCDGQRHNRVLFYLLSFPFFSRYTEFFHVSRT